MKKIAVFLLAVTLLYLSVLSPERVVQAASNPTITVDQHLDGTYVQDILHITGTAFNTTGIAYICYRIDTQNYWTSASLNSQGSTTQYSADLDVSHLEAGSHTISIAARGNDNGLAQISFTVSKASPVISAFSPKSDVTYAWGQAIPVNGFAEFPEGTFYACISLDGQNWIYITSGVETKGLDDYFHGAYKNAENSGFSYMIPPKTLSPGTHIIGIAAYGYAHSDPIITTVTIHVAATSSAIQLNQNLDNTYAQGNISISGTAFDASGIAYVCTNVQGQNYWNFANWNSQETKVPTTAQYTANIDFSALHTGANVITIAVRGEDNSLAQTSFTVIKAEPLIRLFSPNDNSFYSTSQDIPVSGFAEFPEGMYYACISLDGSNWTFMNYNTATQGLNSYFHGAYNNAENSGFLYTIPKGALSVGTHTIGVAAYGYAGESVLTTFNVSITGNLPASSSDLSNVIDISHYNYEGGNSIYWNSLPSNLGAVYMKATQGTSYTDPTISQSVQGAQSRGYKYGFYHFLNFNQDPQDAAQQADHFYDVIKGYSDSCVPVLDVEYTYDKNNNPCAPNPEGTYTGQQIANMTVSFIKEFNAISGNRGVMVYANPNMINSYLVWADNDVKTFLSQQRLWLSDYGSHYNDKYYYPVTPNPISYHTNAIWAHWDMWQYTENMWSVGGITGAVDGDWATDNIFLK